MRLRVESADLDHGLSTSETRIALRREADRLSQEGEHQRAIAAKHVAAIPKTRGRSKTALLRSWADRALEKAVRYERRADQTARSATSYEHPWEAAFPSATELRVLCNGGFWTVRPEAQSASTETPFALEPSLNRRYYWLFDGQVYSAPAPLTSREVLALIRHREARDKGQIARALAQLDFVESVSADDQRKPIADEIKVAVWRRDGGRCVVCKANANLEFDHIIPVSMGGANTFRNLQILCANCNRSKGGNLT